MEFKSLEELAGHKNMRQLIQLRWVAIFGQALTIAIVHFVFKVDLSLPPMLEVLAGLLAFNIGCQLRWHDRKVVTNRELFLSLCVDVAALTLQLYFSGGITNPFVFLYLMQIVLSGILLDFKAALAILAASIGCVLGLVLFSQPLDLPMNHQLGFSSLYIQGTIICFTLNAVLLTLFIQRIRSNLRDRDAEISQIQFQAAEERHIIRMALLASGAAHELGTPLATLSIILGDWCRMPELARNQVVQSDIAEMQTQLQRCKSILTGVLMSAGETRGEESLKTTMKGFLDSVVAEWRESRRVVDFEYLNGFNGDDIAVVSDTTIKQMIVNVLNNALDASPNWVKLEASREDGFLKVVVTDAGAGFDPQILAQFGNIYQSTKGQLGGGLGLFLVIKVADELGGTVNVQNLPTGGAQVTLFIPLESIQLE
ncbi:two-component system, sensor histidine kinase RegB [Polynucleobacter meluiroseus]|uniref:histidine kinase n=1 Tax=Polynucleobacter meluiroseus TaxID=1938814 RepID=A0A240DXZ8_9BURK|nr:ATP-binding protein [Polynucleobacter meluiroseus]SNX28078.1 two-component system, sensor histidine kinase RegB [Polynucleobacter meluiroseus]